MFKLAFTPDGHVVIPLIYVEGHNVIVDECEKDFSPANYYKASISIIDPAKVDITCPMCLDLIAREIYDA